MLLNCGVGEDYPLRCKEIQSVHPKENQSWILEELLLKLKLQYLVKNWIIGKDPDIGKDWRQEEKGTIEDEIVE